VDKRVAVKKNCDSLKTRAIPERFCDGLAHKEALCRLSSTLFTFYRLQTRQIVQRQCDALTLWIRSFSTNSFRLQIACTSDTHKSCLGDSVPQWTVSWLATDSHVTIANAAPTRCDGRQKTEREKLKSANVSDIFARLLQKNRSGVYACQPRFGPHPIHEMRTIAIDAPIICQSVMRADCAKAAEQIDVLFGVETPGDIVLDGSSPSPTARGWRFDAAFANA